MDVARFILNRNYYIEVVINMDTTTLLPLKKVYDTIIGHYTHNKGTNQSVL